MKSLLSKSLATVGEKSLTSIQGLRESSINATIGFFDLAGSTALKIRKGHRRGVTAALLFASAAAEVTRHFRGRVIKESGDGLLCTFSDPIDACRAAANIKEICPTVGLTGRFGLTLGRMSQYTRSTGQEDIYGAAVDRCARIQSVASVQQILIDEPLYEVVKSYLTEYQDAIIGKPFILEAKGAGRLHLWEISTHRDGLIDRIATPFRVYAAGRVSIEEKVQFARHATTEVIEIGTGLTSFAKYFRGQRPGEFRDHIAELLRNGVTVKCFAVDPTYEPARLALREADEPDYESDSLRARRLILNERHRLLAKAYRGQLEYYTYQHVPSFHAICVDGEDPENGRILFAPYLPGLSRAECPVYQVSRIADAELYDKFWRAIQAVQRLGTELR